MSTRPVNIQLAPNPSHNPKVNWGGLYNIKPYIFNVDGPNAGFMSPVRQYGPFQQMSSQPLHQLGQNQALVDAKKGALTARYNHRENTLAPTYQVTNPTGQIYYSQLPFAERQRLDLPYYQNRGGQITREAQSPTGSLTSVLTADRHLVSADHRCRCCNHGGGVEGYSTQWDSPYRSEIAMELDHQGVRERPMKMIEDAVDSEGFAVNDPNAFIWNARYKLTSGSGGIQNPGVNPFSDFPLSVNKTRAKNNRSVKVECKECGISYKWDPTANFFGNVAGTAPGQRPPSQYIPVIRCHGCKQFIKISPSREKEGFQFVKQPPRNYPLAAGRRQSSYKNRLTHSRYPLQRIWVWDYRPYSQGFKGEAFGSRKCRSSWECEGDEVCFEGVCVDPYY